MSSVFVLSSCLKEDAPFDSDKIYETENGMQTAASGVFAELAHFNYFGADYWHLTNLYSGLFLSPKPGDLGTIVKLNVPPNLNYNDNVWRRGYSAINRANTFIDNVEGKAELTEVEHNELGQIYFLRAYSYFNLVRLWGKVPLKIGITTSETLFTPRTDRAKVYEQIIADVESAKKHYLEANGVFTNGRPKVYAANMLLTKVYMTLADADIDAADLNQDEVLTYLGLTPQKCWENAEIEALEVVNNGGYSLVSDFSNIWKEETRNSSESIFEIQFNVENAYSGKLWNKSKSYKGGAGWSRMSLNPNVIDEFIRANMVSDIDAPAASGKIEVTEGDPRYYETFKVIYGIYPKTDNKKYYPADKLKNKNFYPISEKYSIKNLEQSTDASNKNMVIYRYADLLLMLAEIENELDKPAEFVNYVNQVLDRARGSKHIDASTRLYVDGNGVHPLAITDQGKDLNREEIFKQYRFELLSEGHDGFNNRRKGYDWFKSHIIDPHNNRPGGGEFLVPIVDNKQKVMLLPIPLTEINTNQKISTTDQNPGY